MAHTPKMLFVLLFVVSWGGPVRRAVAQVRSGQRGAVVRARLGVVVKQRPPPGLVPVPAPIQL